MFNKLMLSSIFLIFLCFSLNSYAEQYMGIGVGQSKFDPGNVTLDDDSDDAWALFYGKDFDENWSGEVYYHDLGSIKYLDKVDFSALGFSGLYHWPNSSDDWSVYGRAGITRLSNSSTALVDSDDSFELGYGLGVRWNFKEDWFSRFEYRGYGDETSAIFLTAGYKFGG